MLSMPRGAVLLARVPARGLEGAHACLRGWPQIWKRRRQCRSFACIVVPKRELGWLRWASGAAEARRVVRACVNSYVHVRAHARA